MAQTTQRLSARMRNCISYSMWLTGEVKVWGWAMEVDKDRLLAAIDAAVGPAGAVTLVVCERGLSVRSGAGARDIPAFGAWASPIVLGGARLRSLVESLPGPEVHLEYTGGRLSVDWKKMKAREL